MQSLSKLFTLEYKWKALAVTTVGVFMAGVDSTILIIALPTMASALHADAEQAIWFTQAYALASTVAVLLIGKITDMYGRIKLYKIGFILFTVGSLFTALSQDPYQLIGTRAIQGLGAAMIWANSLAIITDATPVRELGFSLGMNFVAYYVGSVMGLTLSGAILLFFDWRVLFYINVPIGIVGTVWAHLNLVEKGTLEKKVSIDWIGFLLFSIGLSCFMLVLTYSVYGIATLAILALLFSAIVCFGLFAFHERRATSPLLDLGLLRIKSIRGSILSNMIQAIVLGSILLLLSLYLQVDRGYSPFSAGMSLLPMDIAIIVFSPLAGRLADRFGLFPFMSFGLLISAFSVYLLSIFTGIAVEYSYLAGVMVLLGAGVGMFTSPNARWGMADVPVQNRGVGASVRSVFYNVGFSISLNLVFWIMSFTVPYSIMTHVVSEDFQALSSSQLIVFVNGLSNAYVWLAILSGMALIPIFLNITTTKEKLEPKQTG